MKSARVERAPLTNTRPTPAGPAHVRLLRGALAAALAVFLLAACSSGGGGGGNAVPRGWIGKEYRKDGGIGSYWLAPTTAPARVADAIHGHRRALDRTSGGTSQFLRYRDDMVTVTPYGGGSRIEIEDYRNGYRRHSSYLTNWPDPDGDSFRGGGPGSGK
ncbi:DUF4247 domain-containing protein [Streptomyces sp. NPDC058417]|uniref:DUF4247 domain-containing protein n=1 Tax=unclassified Streptomyces TaxID=2593676 RepID=UPI0036483112